MNLLPNIVILLVDGLRHLVSFIEKKKNTFTLERPTGKVIQ